MVEKLEHGPVRWDDAGGPYSASFGDVYSSRDGGPGEARHVFLGGNRLPERWLGVEGFTVAELGFGTGLNFILTQKLWLDRAPASARLHYLAVEKYPLRKSDLERALETALPREPQVADLVRQYPPAVAGFHRLFLGAGRVVLTLLYGDVGEQLAAIPTSPSGWVDAWYLDGFSPRVNPEMWDDGVVREMARLTRPGGTVATYTVAGEIRRRIEGAGFRVEKRPGFGAKREMLTAHLPGRPRSESPPGRTVVIGGGLAGTATAKALSRRGVSVTLIERHGSVAAETSGNPCGIVMPYPSPSPGARTCLLAEAFGFVGRHLEFHSGPQSEAEWSPVGVLELATNDRQIQRFARIGERIPRELGCFVEAANASETAGVSIDAPALHYPSSGWVHPPGVCRSFVPETASTLRMRLGHEALSLVKEGDGTWRVCGDGGQEIAQGETIVLANAREAVRFAMVQELPLRTVRGQLTLLPQTARSAKLKRVLCYGGYLLPARQGVHTLGATFDRGRNDPEIDPRDHERNLTALAERIPELSREWQGCVPAGRVGFRSTTPDHFPIVGALERSRGVFVNLAHGSRGLVSAPLTGEILASQICGDPLPVEHSVLEALSPERFTVS